MPFWPESWSNSFKCPLLIAPEILLTTKKVQNQKTIQTKIQKLMLNSICPKTSIPNAEIRRNEEETCIQSGRPQRTTGNHGGPQGTTGDHGGPPRTTRGATETTETTETTGDHGAHETTGDHAAHGRPQETTGWSLVVAASFLYVPFTRRGLYRLTL